MAAISDANQVSSLYNGTMNSAQTPLPYWEPETADTRSVYRGSGDYLDLIELFEAAPDLNFLQEFGLDLLETPRGDLSSGDKECKSVGNKEGMSEADIQEPISPEIVKMKVDKCLNEGTKLKNNF